LELLLLGLGGAAGSIARYKLGSIISQRMNTTFPAGTFIINITGAVLLGIVSGMHVGGNMYLLLADGFLGAYTTFSTFMYEGITLFQGKEKMNAFIYIAGSLIVGIIGYFIGFETGIRIIY